MSELMSATRYPLYPPPPTMYLLDFKEEVSNGWGVPYNLPGASDITDINFGRISFGKISGKKNVIGNITPLVSVSVLSLTCSKRDAATHKLAWSGDTLDLLISYEWRPD